MVGANNRHEIGDLIFVRSSDNAALRIVQILTITCSAGTQVAYEGKLLMKRYGNSGWEPTRDTGVRYYEIELGKEVDEVKKELKK